MASFCYDTILDICRNVQPGSVRVGEAGRRIELTQRDPPASLPLQAAGDLQFQKNDADLGGGRAGEPDQVVDRDRRRPEQGERCARAPAASGAMSCGTRRQRLAAPAEAEARPRIGSMTDTTSPASVTSVAPCLMQAVGALGARIERRAGHGEHLAALLERAAGR